MDSACAPSFYGRARPKDGASPIRVRTPPMIKLYDLERSGNCYKARLMLSLLGLKYDKVNVDLSKGEQKNAEFLAVNPLGSIPALDDNGVIIRDSAAILVYLGSKYGQGKWYPKSPKGQGKVQQWLAISSNEVFHGLAIPRAIRLGLRQGDAAAGEVTGRKVLDLLETRLKGDEWLVAGKPSVADVAMYPYVAMAPQGGILLDQHLGVRKWIRRVEGLEGYLALPQPPRKA
jgi:glutathione S-transferase